MKIQDQNLDCYIVSDLRFLLEIQARNQPILICPNGCAEYLECITLNKPWTWWHNLNGIASVSLYVCPIFESICCVSRTPRWIIQRLIYCQIYKTDLQFWAIWAVRQWVKISSILLSYFGAYFFWIFSWTKQKNVLYCSHKKLKKRKMSILAVNYTIGWNTYPEMNM